jgi:hypothetical protein
MTTLTRSSDPLHHNIQPVHNTVKTTALNFNLAVGYMAISELEKASRHHACRRPSAP